MSFTSSAAGRPSAGNNLATDLQTDVRDCDIFQHLHASTHTCHSNQYQFPDLRVCTPLLNGMDGKVKCPMQAFAAHLNKTGASFPVSPARFQDSLYAFVTSEAGRGLRKHIGFEAPNTDGSTPRLFYQRITVGDALLGSGHENRFVLHSLKRCRWWRNQ